MRRLGTLVFLAASCLGPRLRGAGEASVESFLKEAAGKFRALDSYTIEFLRTDESKGGRMVNHRRISFVRPFRFHVQDLSPVVLFAGNTQLKACPLMTQIDDGTASWLYSEELKQYSSMGFDPAKEDPAAQFAVRIPDRLDHIELTPEEKDSKVSADRGGVSLTVWIDNQRGFVVKWILYNPQNQTG